MARTITSQCTKSYHQVKHALNGGQRQIVRKFYSQGMLDYMKKTGFNPDKQDDYYGKD